MKKFIMYLRDDRNRPIGTRCILVDGDKAAFGMAMCSDKENPSKKVGKAIAEGRAKKLLFKEKVEMLPTRKGDFFFYKGLNYLNENFRMLLEPERRWLEREYGR